MTNKQFFLEVKQFGSHPTFGVKLAIFYCVCTFIQANGRNSQKLRWKIVKTNFFVNFIHAD